MAFDFWRIIRSYADEWVVLGRDGALVDHHRDFEPLKERYAGMRPQPTLLYVPPQSPQAA